MYVDIVISNAFNLNKLFFFFFFLYSLSLALPLPTSFKNNNNNKMHYLFVVNLYACFS